MNLRRKDKIEIKNIFTDVSNVYDEKGRKEESIMLANNIVLFSNFEYGMDTLKECFSIINSRGVLTVSELGKLIGDTDNTKYGSAFGWTNLFDSNLKPCLNGTWIMRLPQPKRLKISYTIKINNRKGEL